jgi:hypothetical protein
MLTQFSLFHTTAAALQLTDHTLYPKVDFKRLDAGCYAIVDPVEPSAILYVSEKEYLLQIRVHLSQDVPLVVLGRPGDKPQAPHPLASKQTSADPSSTSVQNSPPSGTKTEVARPGHEPEHLKIPWRMKRNNYYSGSPYGVRRESVLVMDAKHPWQKFLSWHISRLAAFASKRKDGKGSAMVVPSPESVMTLIRGWGFDLNFRLGGPLETPRSLRLALDQLGKDLTRVLQTRGPAALILKMKNTLFFMDKWLGGTMNENPFLLGEPVGLARSGLPRIIPLVIRRRIGAGDIVAIRLMESILSGYKVFEGPYELQDLKSITGGLPAIRAERLEEFRVFCRDVFWPMAKTLSREANKELFPPVLRSRIGSQPYIPYRAGPNHRVGLLGAHLDTIAWTNCPVNWPLEWAKHVGDSETVDLFSSVQQKALAWCELARPHTSYETSALALLPEPAGKVRTVAIADYWTQRLMKPVHDWMMSVLSVLPTDATFGQESSLESYVRYTLVEKVANHYSIDLKSATDLIPITLYETLFTEVWGKETTELWIALLTDRWFRTPDDPLLHPKLRSTVLRYGRGQPMGTLSSWASMALVHHALELFSAQCAGKDPTKFLNYRVLGDDNVTGDPLVAKAYLDVVSDLGVPTSPAKTLVGKLFTFASQKYFQGVNVSPISLKEEMGVKSSAQRLELAFRTVRRGWLAEKPTIARFLRLLLRHTDYVRSMKEFARGKLGGYVQAALVSALGSSGRLLDNLGFPGSGSKPFLLALQNKVEALAGDRGSLDARTRVLFGSIQLSLAIVIARRAVTLLRTRLDDLRVQSIRFSEWRAGIHDCGILPRSWRGKLPKGGTYGRTGWWILNYPERGFPYEKCGVGGNKSPPFPREVQSLFDQALWPVIESSYAPFFGGASGTPYSSDWSSFINDDEGWSEEDLGMGITFSNKSDSVGSTGGQSYTMPAADALCQEALDKALPILERLQRADPDEEGFDPWPEIDSLFEVIARVPRLPDFYVIGDLVPSRSPRDMDLLKAWVRQMTSYHEVMRYIPLGLDLSVISPVEGDHLTLRDDAFLSTSRGVLNDFKGTRRLPLGRSAIIGKTGTLVAG